MNGGIMDIEQVKSTESIVNGFVAQRFERHSYPN